MNRKARSNPRWPLLFLVVAVFALLALPHSTLAATPAKPNTGALVQPLSGGGPNGASDPDELGIYSRHALPPNAGAVGHGVSAPNANPPVRGASPTVSFGLYLRTLLVELHLLY